MFTTPSAITLPTPLVNCDPTAIPLLSVKLPQDPDAQVCAPQPALISLITEECFDDLDCRPIRLSSQDIPTPYNGNLENLTIIQPHQIIDKVVEVINGSI